MSRKRKRQPGWRPSQLDVPQILAWADAFHERTGRWPARSLFHMAVPGAVLEKWSAINSALGKGLRGLPGGSSLPRLLAEHRGVRNRKGLPRLTHAQILAWADAYHQRAGRWPRQDTVPQLIPGSSGEKWQGVDDAMRRGLRGLPRDGSLARLLAQDRGVRNPQDLPPLTEEQILAWADAFYHRTGRWPRQENGSDVIPGSRGETWLNVEQALVKGLRGLPGGATLARLLADHRGVRNVGNLPRLMVEQILTWADAHHEHFGRWPGCRCPEQTIDGSFGERWFNVDQALRKGLRGLPGGSSLARVLARHRGVRYPGVAGRS
ncbi:hypothetical protein [Fimbriiglobus ruber]|nr:hypothetical protein [Fimbriiglobus ruber]